MTIPAFFASAIPQAPASSVVEWAEKNVRLPGSARSERFQSSISPWTREPMERAGDGVTRICTFVKPVQAGGSVAGEIALCYWLATQNSGDVQYNWENDEKALERWDKRIERILQACAAVKARWPSDRHKGKRGLVIFPHANLTVQGVWQPDNLDSDSIRFQVNEEVHNWEPGRLAKAYNRTTAFWNSVVFNISNAGVLGDQLHQAFEAGTQQHWEVQCPGCGQFHTMRTAWDDKRPDLGGLRYDGEKCRRDDGTYNYNQLAPTIRYQMPCGFLVHDTPSERRALSVSGRYSEPRNTGAHLSHRSYTLEAVSVDYIPWLKLITEKHAALRAMKLGDPEPFKRYVQERECRFWDPEERPLVGKIVLNTERTKTREGLENRVLRGMAVDKQAGEAARGEVPHFWVVIRDFDKEGNSLLVFEGKVTTEEDVDDLCQKYRVEPRFVLYDSGYAAPHVYRHCARRGYNAVKGEDRDFYNHTLDDDTRIRRIYSPIQWVDPFEGDRTGKAGTTTAPLILYSKQGIRDRLAWLRSQGGVRWEVPGDVSEDYQRHMEAEEQQEFRHAKTNEKFTLWVQVQKRNDLFVCECYLALLAEMAGIIGAGAVKEQKETK